MKKTVILVSVVIAVLIALALANRKPSSAADTDLVGGVPVVDLQGQQLSLEEYKGKVVLVNFWATWCSPCRIEIPWLIEFQEKYGPRGFTVVGVAVDVEGKSVVVPYLKQERFDVNGQKRAINYPIAIGGDVVEQQFDGVLGYPTSVLIARDGTRVKRILGLINHETLQKEIEALL